MPLYEYHCLECANVFTITVPFSDLFQGCEVGAEPPFGNLFNIEEWVDSSLTENEEIVFNAGNHRETVRMRYDDFA